MHGNKFKLIDARNIYKFVIDQCTFIDCSIFELYLFFTWKWQTRRSEVYSYKDAKATVSPPKKVCNCSKESFKYRLSLSKFLKKQIESTC